MQTRDQDELFASWTAEYMGIVFKVARSFASSDADRDDLVQEILLQLWRSAGTFRGDAKASTWVYRVAFNRAISWRRRDDATMSRRTPMFDMAQLASPARADENQRLNTIYEQIRTLKQIDRSLIVLSLDGLSYADMAQISGLSESNVGVRLTRARKQLANLLKGTL